VLRPESTSGLASMRSVWFEGVKLIAILINEDQAEIKKFSRLTVLGQTIQPAIALLDFL
jgi:hypothetical protein